MNYGTARSGAVLELPQRALVNVIACAEDRRAVYGILIRNSDERISRVEYIVMLISY